MGSRRMTRSSFSNGRSSSGEDSNGTSRPNGCSYISNVRPENRSTLCTMMAQLAEETQPFFEITLKSKAVSENSNVKFSCVVTGHPAPKLIWYKEDMQLDRYCGLPKYEIFHNGQHHSLHIYNCTLEDAAIYQASASNSKGIVSCSGVLEVGGMNEFKIHERYFAKLKQKARRCKEEGGKENLEPLRTISPERTPRKRRSTMEGFLSMPSSMEDEGADQAHQAVKSEETAEETLAPISNGVVSAVIDGQTIIENGTMSGTYTHDSAQKVFTAHPPKTPSTKKIKIAPDVKSDTKGERASEPQKAEDESSKRGATKPVEVMEVDSLLPSSTVKNSRDVTENQKATAALASAENPLKAVSANGPSVAPRKAHLTPKAATAQTVAAAEGKGPARKVKEETSPTQKLIPDDKIAKPQQSAAAPRPSRAKRIEDVAARKSKDKPETTAGAAAERKAGLPQRERAGDQPSEKEFRPHQKNLSEVQPVLPREVAQGRTKMSRNDAAVSLEVSPSHLSAEAQPPQKTPSKRDAPADNIKTPTFNPGPQAPTDRMVKDTWGHSGGSNESRMVPFTDGQKSPLQNPGTGEKSRGCKVSPSTRLGQADAAIKTVKETEKQAGRREETRKVGDSTRSQSKASREKIETETESADGRQTTEKNGNSAADKGMEKVADAAVKQSEKSEQTLKSAEEASPRSSDLPDPAEAPQQPPQRQAKDSHTHTATPPKVISIAELLRSQIKALESMLANSVADVATQEPPSTETLKNVKDDKGKRILEAKTSDRKIEDIPLRNIRETLLEVYQQLQLDQAQREIHDAIVAPVQASETVPPVSAVDAGTTTESCNTQKVLCQETEAALLSDSPTSVGEGTETPPPVKPETSAPESNIPVIKQVKDETGQDKQGEFITKSSPVVKDGVPTESETSEKLSDQSKTDKHTELPSKKNEILNVQKPPAESGPIAHLQAIEFNQQDSLTVEDIPQTDSSAGLSPKTSPLPKRRSRASIPAATEQELASGARRKIPKEKTSPSEAPSPVDNQVQVPDPSNESPRFFSSPASLPSSPSLQKRSQLLPPVATGEPTPSLERHSSPVLSRRKTQPETPTQSPNTSEEMHVQQTEEKPAAKKKHDPFKAPQVIRKIRSETFADSSGHLKLWCQFFNVLTDSTIRWFRNEEEIAQVKRSAGDEAQVNLAVVQASYKDSGVYRCTITNDYGTDSTDFLLSGEILTGMSIREDIGVGEEIEMTPMIFSKGVADSGAWGNKFFGRVVMQESHIGDGCSHKVWRAKVIYGLEPVFDSGNTCIIKVRNYVPFGGKGESCLTDKNLEIITQECKIQNLAREYCKIFSAEARIIDSFGPSLEVLPVYLMYRPANAVPYVTAEADLPGDYQRYSVLDQAGRIDMRTGSDAEQKCCALQHWIFQWTNGNMLLTRLEGVDMKITNVGISVKSSGHQGLSVEGNPKVFEHFISHHRCNYFCGLLCLRSLKVADSLLTTGKPKASKSPLLQRKMAADSSPQMGRKASGSPRLPRKTDQEGRKTPGKQPPADAPAVIITE